ncbi:MAG TPA: hypothetical protein VEQ42_00265, partial [Pyrinomonadaceae bacterium]|nr:hypothetical protein [Pyrinomonadaceae bacterium]
YVTSRALNFRRARRELFDSGEYVPLAARGARSHHVVAFARRRGEDEAIAVASRFFTGLTNSHGLPLGAEVWGDTFLPLDAPQGKTRLRDVFTGREFDLVEDGGAKGLRLSEVFGQLTVALLERV